MVRTLALTLILSIALVGHLAAADLMYGAGTLPKLAGDANLVIHIKVATIATQLENAALVSVVPEPGTAWKGSPGNGPLLVLYPSLEKPLEPTEIIDSVLFLRGPLNESQRRFWKVDAQTGDVYQLVGGNHGIVELRPPNEARRFALATYLMANDAADPEAARLKWAQKNVANSDIFLQESALFELERQDDKQARLTTLSGTISHERPPTTAAYALAIVGDSTLPQAVDVLVRAASNRKLTAAIRRQAVSELMDRSDAAGALQKLIAGNPFVAATVEEIRKTSPDQ